MTLGGRGDGPIRLLRENLAFDPPLDTALSRALLLGASDGVVPETLRLHVPGRVMAFGKRDTLAEGYPPAVAASRDAGFVPIERLAGGRAAVFTELTLSFAWTVPDPDPRTGIAARFEYLSAAVVRTLAAFGVDSEVGEIPGEYCPGRYSVHHRGRIKLMGVGQRLARSAAHVGGVIVVDGADLARAALVPVYAALGLEWDPSTVGSIADVTPGVTVEDIATRFAVEIAGDRGTAPGTVAGATRELAARLAPEHASPHAAAAVPSPRRDTSSSSTAPTSTFSASASRSATGPPPSSTWRR